MVELPGRNISRADAETAGEQLLEMLSRLAQLLPRGVDAPKIFRFIERVRDDPQAVRREMVEMILSGEISFEDFTAERAALQKFASAPRRLLDEVRKEFPAGLPGRPGTFVDDDFLAERVHQVLPISRALVVLRSHSTTQTMAKSLEYLAPQFPEPAVYLLDRVDEVGEIFQDNAMKRARTVEGKAKVLAYLLAGAEAGFHGKEYALRQVRTALRRVKQRQSIKP